MERESRQQNLSYQNYDQAEAGNGKYLTKLSMEFSTEKLGIVPKAEAIHRNL